jgi:hypothetical protein
MPLAMWTSEGSAKIRSLGMSAAFAFSMRSSRIMSFASSVEGTVPLSALRIRLDLVSFTRPKISSAFFSSAER